MNVKSSEFAGSKALSSVLLSDASLQVFCTTPTAGLLPSIHSPAEWRWRAVGASIMDWALPAPSGIGVGTFPGGEWVGHVVPVCASDADTPTDSQLLDLLFGSS